MATVAISGRQLAAALDRAGFVVMRPAAAGPQLTL
jgi:Holliday junction resolvase